MQKQNKMNVIKLSIICSSLTLVALFYLMPFFVKKYTDFAFSIVTGILLIFVLALSILFSCSFAIYPLMHKYRISFICFIIILCFLWTASFLVIVVYGHFNKLPLLVFTLPLNLFIIFWIACIIFISIKMILFIKKCLTI